MKTTGLPPITRREFLCAVLIALFLAGAVASVDQVADGTPSNAPVEVSP